MLTSAADKSELLLRLMSIVSHQLVMLLTSITNSIKDVLQAFAENMLLCGGGSGIPGLHALFAAEMQSVSPPSLQPTICSCPDYMPENTLRYSSWMGAAILSKVRAVQDAAGIKLLRHGRSGAAYEACLHHDSKWKHAVCSFK